MDRRARTYRGALALLLAGGILATGCSGSGTGNESATADRGIAGSGGPAGGEQPPAAPSAVPGQDEDGAGQAEDGARESVAPDYLSTFALDVDTASYGYARRTLGDGQLPAAGTVRPEEFVNSFRQGYERPTATASR